MYATGYSICSIQLLAIITYNRSIVVAYNYRLFKLSILITLKVLTMAVFHTVNQASPWLGCKVLFDRLY